MSEPDLSEIRVDPLINKEEVLIQNNQPQELKIKNERSLWLGSIMREVTEDKKIQPLSTNISRVPRKLRNENEECYIPKVVSIGPYHYGTDDRLREVETLKVPMARQFILDSGKDIELIYSEVEKVIKTARESYDEDSITRFDDEQFTQMMFLDGCFILQFISCATHNYENLEMSDRQVAGVKRDLLLLENQVPFPVLQSLMRLRYGNDETNHGMKLLNDFLFYQILKPRDQPLWTRRLLGRNVAITLLLMYVSACESSGMQLTSHELKKVGIHFMPSQTSGLMDVKFKSSFFYGTVKLPSLTIDVSTKPCSST
uniref:Uncharacterized protein n=1 Tax=Salix viminalis TaxID=40686 RepID=A0A6N2N554_SALVM